MDVDELLSEGKSLLKNHFGKVLVDSSNNSKLFELSSEELEKLSDDDGCCLKAVLSVYQLLEATEHCDDAADSPIEGELAVVDEIVSSNGQRSEDDVVESDKSEIPEDIEQLKSGSDQIKVEILLQEAKRRGIPIKWFSKLLSESESDCIKAEILREEAEGLLITTRRLLISLKTPRDLQSQTGRSFWYLYEAGVSGVLPTDIDSWLLKALSCLEKSTRVTYEPDVDDFDKASLLDIYSHIAAAYALALKRREEGYSEESRRVFNDAWKATDRYLPRQEARPIIEDTKIEFQHAFAALKVLLARHLFMICTSENDWQRALLFFTCVVVHYGELQYAEPGGPYFAPRWSRVDNVDDIDERVEFAKSEVEREMDRLTYRGPRYSLYFNYEELLDEKHCQMAANVFENIKNSGMTNWDWGQLLKYCGSIIEYWPHIDIYNDEAWVRDSRGQVFESISYWNGAKGWLEANLEPSELRDELRKEEDEKAEQRLKRYFFSEEQWNQISERAQGSLVGADRVWYAPRAGNVGSVLEDLRIATEEVLYELFWRPCYKWLDNKKSLDDPRLLDLHTIREELNQNNKQPSLVEFEWMLGSESFKIFCETLTLDKEQREFVLRNLPEALKELRRERRRAAHSIGRVIRRGEVSRLYSGFLGIGRYGVLPRLIDLKLQLSRAQKA